MRSERKGRTLPPWVELMAPARGAIVQRERGRVCVALNCDTQLSIYNSSDRCFIHEGFAEPSANATATGGAVGEDMDTAYLLFMDCGHTVSWLAERSKKDSHPRTMRCFICNTIRPVTSIIRDPRYKAL